MKINRKDKTLNIVLIIAVIILIIIAVFIVYRFFQIKSYKPTEYKIVLQGDKYVTINEDEEYSEPGFIAYRDNADVTKEAEVINEVEIGKPGIYKIVYKIDNYSDYRIVEIKRVINYELTLSLIENIKELTNQDVLVSVKVDGETFYSLTLPNGYVVYENEANYTISENGVYEFKATNENNEEFTNKIEITNIDREAPTGTCTATLTNTNTVITVQNDENNIKYSYYDDQNLLTTSDNNNYTSSTKTSKNITVELEDLANNKNKITCTIIDNSYYEPVKPNSNDKIVYHGNSNTLKTYIVNRGTYYLTYIWVKDAYSQLNKFDSPEYGTNLYLPKDLLSKANNKYGLKSKIVVGFNASGFYLKGVYDKASVQKYPAYDKTSVGTLVITDGKVVRNAYNHADKTWYMIGVNKENKMLIFEDKASNDVNAKKEWSQSVIDSGIRNTFTFASPIIMNGKKSNITTNLPYANNKTKIGLQMICQINENNFILFTAGNEAREVGINEFLKLGCQTALNLDGGGSIALLYKKPNSNEIIRVTGNGRQLSEVGYFTE